VLATGGELRAAPAATALLLLAPAGWAVGSLLVRRWDVGKGVMGAATQTITGGVTMILLALALGERMPETAVPLSTLGAMAYLVVFGSLAGFARVPPPARARAARARDELRVREPPCSR
jgi:drug/metabolite transporter (DMT)-like permease